MLVVEVSVVAAAAYIDDGFNMGGGTGGGSDSGVFAEKIDGVGVGFNCGTMVTETKWAVMMVVAIM